MSNALSLLIEPARAARSVDCPIQHFVSWVVCEALPVWATRPTSTSMPFAESLDWHGQLAQPGYLRLRVIARQVSVYSQAVRSGLGWARGIADAGWNALVDHFWSSSCGWTAYVTEGGRVTGPRASLYDQAFAIYACAHRARIANCRQPLDLAWQALEMIDARLRDPLYPGWRTADDDPSFDQNSHMHLLEALLAWHHVEPEDGLHARIDEILGLLASHLVDPVSGVVRERFDKQWAVPESGAVVEPGHQYEWVWLIAAARRQGFAVPFNPLQLFNFAQRHGWNCDTGLIVDACKSDGSQTSEHHRLWPHCEAIRAATVIEDEGAGRVLAEQIAERTASVFLAGPFVGGWIDRLDHRLNPTVVTVPASSLYHLWEAALALVLKGWAVLPGRAQC